MNKTDQIESKLAALRDELLPYGVTGIRFDYLVTDAGISRRILVLDRHGTGNRFALISRREGLREKGIRAMVNNLPMDREQANRVLDLADDLSELNDMGAWPLEITEREPVIGNYAGVGGTPYRDLPGFKRRYNNLLNRLPSVRRIDVQVHIGTSKKGNSRKGWITFFDCDGVQLASIATNHLATMLRDWYGTDDKAHAVADANTGRWARQLDVDLDDFMDVAMDLLSFDNLLQVTGLHLDQPA